MTTSLDIQIVPFPTHREEKPARTCMVCGCWLRSFHDSEVCDPCGHADWELTDDEVIQLISEVPDYRRRQSAFDALAQIHEEAAA